MEPQRTAAVAASSEVRAIAVSTAHGIESRANEPGFPETLFEDVLDIQADTTGTVTLVLTVGGPYTELVLRGRGYPRVNVFWGTERSDCPVFIDQSLIEDEIGIIWTAVMHRALADSPYTRA